MNMGNKILVRLGWILACGVAGFLLVEVVTSHLRSQGSLLLEEMQTSHLVSGGRVTRTQAAEKDLTQGINYYLVEYNRYPIPSEAQNAPTDQRFESTGKLLAVLLGKNLDGRNPREIECMDPPLAKDGKRGLIPGSAPGEARLVDFWGHPYVILFDTNHDNKIDNPDRKNPSPQVRQDAPEQLIARVLVYSLGPDGIDGTPDDIVSWRGTPPLTPTEQLSYALPLVLLGLVVVAFVQGLRLIGDIVQWIFAKRSA